MSGGLTSVHRNTEEVELSKTTTTTTTTSTTAIHQDSTNSIETTNLDEETAANEVVMRKSSSVQPFTEERSVHNNTNESRRDELHDASDGVDPLTPESLAPLMSTNQYTVRKMAAQALIDVALMMANISQMRTLITAGPANMEFYAPLLCMVSISLTFQLVFAILIFIIWMRESDQHQKEEYLATLRQIMENSADSNNVNAAERIRNSILKREEAYKEHRITLHLNYITMVLVFFITVTNMFITGFGIKLDSCEEKATKSP